MAVRMVPTNRKGTILSLSEDKLKIAWDGSVPLARRVPVLRSIFAASIEDRACGRPTSSGPIPFRKGMRVAETNDGHIIPDVDVRRTMTRNGYL